MLLRCIVDDVTALLMRPHPPSPQPFCWLCGQATGVAHTWDSIDGHECGRFREETDLRVNEAARNHKRYMHYFERFKVHDDSHSKEKHKREEVLLRIEEKVQAGHEAIDLGWLMQVSTAVRPPEQYDVLLIGVP